MNRIIVLCSCLLLAINTAAQKSGGLLYIDAGLGGGSVFSLKLGLNYLFYESNVLSLTIYDNYRKSPDVPADYYGSLFQFGKPKDDMVAGVLMYGKMLRSGSRRVRYNLKGGIALGNITYNHNFRPSTPTFFGLKL